MRLNAHSLSVVACLLLVAACGGPDFGVSVDQWTVGSADVSGRLANHSGKGCTDPEVTLKFFDHNGARVQEFTFGAGELADGQTRTWTTHMVGLFDVDKAVASGVTSASATAECADQH